MAAIKIHTKLSTKQGMKREVICCPLVAFFPFFLMYLYACNVTIYTREAPLCQLPRANICIILLSKVTELQVHLSQIHKLLQCQKL